MARIYDNIDMKFEDGLKGIMSDDKVLRVDFCVGYFNLRGWSLIVDQIDNLPGEDIYEGDDRKHRTCRLLVGMHRPSDDLVKQMYSAKKQELPDDKYVNECKLKIARQFRDQLLLGLPTNQDKWTLTRLCAQLKEEKVCVKLYLREPLHAKLYIAHSPDNFQNPRFAIMGSSNLTFPGLTKQGELNADFADFHDAKTLSEWFDDRWNDRFSVEITKELIDAIENSWAGDNLIKPYYIYLKTAYYLSQDARSGINSYELNATFKKELFPFQQNAVKMVMRHLLNEKHKGAMIGDVVGLGKTITACAIAKLFEENMLARTLVICPANLQDMWGKYFRKYDLKGEIMSNAQHIDPEKMYYYRLVIIDESHNLRNPQGTRYRDIKNFIASQENSVLLLTATPYNKDFRDLSTQLKLFIADDQDLGIRPENYIRELGGDNQFRFQHSDIGIRTIRAFERSESVDDWNDLMKLFLVRRTRTFIKNNYAETDETDGRKYLQFSDGTRSYFSNRIPKSVPFDTVPGDQYSRLYSTEMIDLMKQLELPRYGLTQYVSETKSKDADKNEKQLLENLSRAGKRMQGFNRSTFFKRIDSVGFSFLLTVYRHILRNCVFLYAIDQKLKLPIGDENQLPDEFIEDGDTNAIFDMSGTIDPNGDSDGFLSVPTDLEFYMQKAKEYYQIISGKSNVKWIPSSYFKPSLKKQLASDCNVLIDMIKLCGPWNPATDAKLNRLEDLLRNKHKKDKILVFTQYSDTARYLYYQLKRRGAEKIDIATGNSENPTRVAEHFSPKSNEVSIPEEEQTRILIATDVLSEGQNLQDSHIIINFDLPWAIVRLIQRAGRVDRIGQDSKKIYCYSFFPAEGVEDIISLRERLTARINTAADVVGQDEVFWEGTKENLKDLFNEKAGILDDADDNDVDLASQAYEIWNQAIKANPKLKDIIPNMNDYVYGTKAASEEIVNGISALQEGVITYVKTYTGFDMLTWYDSKGEVISQSQKRILKAMECSIDTPALEPLDNHHDLVAKAVTNVKVDNTSASGILGNRLSTRYRILQLLGDYLKNLEKQRGDYSGLLFFANDKVETLKDAIDEIYNNLFTESVKTILGRMLKSNVPHDDIVDYVLELHNSGTLVVKEEATDVNRDNRVICSMGLKIQK